MAIYILNVLAFLSNVMVKNFFLLMSLTLLVVGKAFIVIYLFYLSFFFVNHIFTLEKMRKYISKITSI